MAVSFRATVYSSKSDRDGQTRLTLEIPSFDKKFADQVSGMTNQVLMVTVLQKAEYEPVLDKELPSEAENPHHDE